jgi:hypothetical protein
MSTRRRPSAQRRGPGVGQRMAAVRAALVAAVAPTATLLAVGLVLLLGWRGAQALYAQPVAHIVVSGKLENLHRDAVRQAVAGRIDRGLLALDLRDLRRELEALPWVYRAALRRRFPDTLEIRVVEQLPIARWGDGAFLNHEARVVQVADAARWDVAAGDPRTRRQRGAPRESLPALLELLRPLELHARGARGGRLRAARAWCWRTASSWPSVTGVRRSACSISCTCGGASSRDAASRCCAWTCATRTGAAVAFARAEQLAGLATPVEDR